MKKEAITYGGGRGWRWGCRNKGVNRKNEPGGTEKSEEILVY